MENAKLQTRHVEWWQKSLFALELAKELEGSNLSFKHDTVCNLLSFAGMTVTYPQYLRLKMLQGSKPRSVKLFAFLP